MIAEQIENVKTFMNKLLIEDKFDSLLTTGVSITTYNTFTIDGHIQKDFFTGEEIQELPDTEIVSWKTIKPFCYDIIKGKKTPLKFKIVFKMPGHIVDKIITSNNLNMQKENVQGLFLNIKYENQTLTYVTGCSLTIFDINKEIENAYDKYISAWIDSIVSTPLN